MEELLSRFVQRDKLTPEQIEQNLREADFTTLGEHDAAILLADLLLHEIPIDPGIFEFAPGTPFTDRMIRLKEQGNNNVRKLLCNWFYVSTTSSLYPLYLFNIDYGKTRKVLNLLLKSEKRTPPPYLFRVLQNVILHYFKRKQVAPLIANQENLDIWAPVLNEIFETGRPVKRWLNVKDNTLRFYGGQTNTILEYYDSLCDEDSGFHKINREADAYFDLGGGFNTPEIVRLSDGLPFTSCDIIPPRPTKEIILVKRTPNGELLLNRAARQVYIEKLGQTPYQEFDVFKHHFPTDKQSYVIVSTGFLTSTVRASTQDDGIQYGGKGFYATSLAGITKIVELIRLGKAVDLFTVNRATTRVYAHKTVFASFRDGKLVDLNTVPDTKNRFTDDRKISLLKAIHPDTSPFRDYVSRREPEWQIFPPAEEETEEPDETKDAAD